MFTTYILAVGKIGKFNKDSKNAQTNIAPYEVM